MVVRVSMDVDRMENYVAMSIEYQTNIVLNPPVRLCVALGGD